MWSFSLHFPQNSNSASPGSFSAFDFCGSTVSYFGRTPLFNMSYFCPLATDRIIVPMSRRVISWRGAAEGRKAPYRDHPTGQSDTRGFIFPRGKKKIKQL